METHTLDADHRWIFRLTSIVSGGTTTWSKWQIHIYNHGTDRPLGYRMNDNSWGQAHYAERQTVGRKMKLVLYDPCVLLMTANMANA
jgi:hypothetical protein